jgi:hypothetical protein
MHPCRHLKKISPASFRDTCHWLKFPLNGLQAQSKVSPVVGLLPLASGPACLEMTFPNLDKLLEYKGNWIQHVNIVNFLLGKTPASVCC